QVGCLDPVGGARGVERLHKHLHGEGLSSRVILDSWQAGDARSGETVAVWLEIMAGPLAMVLNVVGATVVPVGGGLANVGALIAALDVAVRARVLRRCVGPLVVRAKHRVEPGLIGASLIGWQGMGDAD
ncbi:MAG: ROK family protein, partial [Paracoccaceae bacterium]